MYFIDANIFLELEILQDKAEECERLLIRLKDNLIKATITDFLVDGIVVVMERYQKSPADIKAFLLALLAFEGLEIHKSSHHEKILATELMQKHDLSFDDALIYQTMKTHNISKIISFDSDFNKIKDIERLEPTQIINLI